MLCREIVNKIEEVYPKKYAMDNKRLFDTQTYQLLAAASFYFREDYEHQSTPL